MTRAMIRGYKFKIVPIITLLLSVKQNKQSALCVFKKQNRLYISIKLFLQNQIIFVGNANLSQNR